MWCKDSVMLGIFNIVLHSSSRDLVLSLILMSLLVIYAAVLIAYGQSISGRLELISIIWAVSTRRPPNLLSGLFASGVLDSVACMSMPSSLAHLINSL